MRQYLRLSDCTLFYETAGSGTPVVYVHGGFASLDTVINSPETNQWTWEYDFADGFFAIFYDRRGCYRSSRPETGYDLLTQSTDLLHLLDHLQITDTHIIGSSAGGPISILFAANYPHRVRSLFLVGTALDLFPESDADSRLVREHVAILHRDGKEVAFAQRPKDVEVSFSEVWDHREAQARGTLAEYREKQAQWRHKLHTITNDQRVHYYATELENMNAYITEDVSVYAAQISVPTYIIHGENDQLVEQAWAEKLASSIPNAKYELIRNGSHTLIGRNRVVRRKVIQLMQEIDRNHNI